jgi:glycerol-3-phosphate dehydrogenase (NAD(P)+)
MKIGVIGSGSWGTALTKIITDNGHDVIWCVRSEKTAAHVRERHHNPKYLSSVYFSDTLLDVVNHPAEVYEQADAILIAVPSAYVDEYVFENVCIYVHVIIYICIYIYIYIL